MVGWDVAWWYSTCLACVRPWVRSQHKKEKTKKKKKERNGGKYVRNKL
jgi:hypothetical protein